LNTTIDIIPHLSNSSYRSDGGAGGGGGGGGGSSIISSSGGSREVIFLIVLKYLTHIHNSTLSPVTLPATLLTVFSGKFIVRFSIA